MAPNPMKIGKYEVLDILGKGGMGVVYKAQDPRIGRLVAIKQMTGSFAENPELLQRFYREAQATGVLQHPNIVIIYDVSDQDGQPYIVMQYLEGEALDKSITARKQFSLIEKLDMMIQVCNGLHYAHQHGIVHRDIKPANIMVQADGSIKIVDFGIARLGDNSMTRTGQLIGTLYYMSPEQINAKMVDRRSDIWSTGVMLYELLTNHLPFEAADTASLLLKIINEPPPPLSQYLENIPPELEDTILRALTKDRDDRYATAEDFAFDLSRVQEKLKRLLIDQQVIQARDLYKKQSSQELLRAKDLLLQVLRLESRHTEAKDLLAEVNGLLQKQQRSEQVRQLRSHAEDAFSQDLFAEALSSLNQAISLDKTNAELLNFRNLVEETKNKKEKVREALRRAESAHQSGNLQSAIQLLEEALALDPNNTAAKAMHTQVAAEAAEQQRQQEVQSLLSQARKEISARKFTEAFNVLEKAKQLDPNAPEVTALINMATSGQDQERRRRELQEATSQIEDALNADDYEAALKRAEAALQKFPADTTLLKLKSMAEKQREAGQKKKFIEEQLGSARQLLDSGNAREALAQLERAGIKTPGDARIASLISFVRETLERQEQEAHKTKAISEAKDALRRKDYAAAIRVLETAHAELEGNPDIADLLNFAREESAQFSRRQKVEQVAAEAQKLIAEGEYERAQSVLQAALKEAPDEELNLLVAQAQRLAADEQSKIETAIGKAKRLFEGRKFEEAVALLESQPKNFARSAAFCEALEKARDEQERVQNIAAALEKARAALAKEDLTAALNIVQGCRKTYGDAPELTQAVTEIESKRGNIARAKVEKAIKDARMLVVTRQYNAVIKVLDGAKDSLAHAPAELKTQLESIRKETESALERQEKKSQLDKTFAEATDAGIGGETIVAGSYDIAQPLPAAEPKAKRVDAPAPGQTAGAPAAAPAREKVAPRPAPVQAPAPIAAPAASGKKIGVIAGAAVAAVLVIIGAITAYKHFFPAVAPATAQVVINPVPWGHVQSLDSVDGKVHKVVDKDTPVYEVLPPGDYKMTIKDPDGEVHTETITASNDEPYIYKKVFKPIDVQELVKQY